MNRLSLHVAAIAALLLASFTLGKDDVNSKLVISEVSRKIDLSTQLTKVSTSLTIENGGDSATGYFHLAIEPSLVDKLAFVGATVSFFFRRPLFVSKANVACVIVFQESFVCRQGCLPRTNEKKFYLTISALFPVDV